MRAASPAVRWTIVAGAWALPLVFIVAPIGTFLLLSFFSVENNTIVRDFTLANYAEFFGNRTYWRTYVGTLWLGTEVVTLCLLIGYPVAWFIWRRRGSIRYALLLLAVLPLFMSYIVKLYTLRAILGLNGLLNQGLLALGLLEKPSQILLYNQRAVLVTMTVIYLPFAILPIFVSLERIPKNLLNASSDLGASPLTTFRHVVLPLSLPGAVAGALFTLVLVLGDFVTPQMVGGPSGFTFGRVIWSQFGLAYNWPFGAAMATILLATAMVVIGVGGYLARERGP